MPRSPRDPANLGGGEFASPLGGTVTVTVSQSGTAIHETLVWVGPDGNTLLSETADLTLNPRTGAVAGSITAVVTAPGGAPQTLTGSLTGTLSDSTLSETATLTGPNGQTIT